MAVWDTWLEAVITKYVNELNCGTRELTEHPWEISSEARDKKFRQSDIL